MEKEAIFALCGIVFGSVSIGLSIANYILVSKMEELYKRRDED